MRLIWIFFLFSLSMAKAPELGLLLHVKNNSLLYFSIDNREQLCIPYGVVTFEMLMQMSKNNEMCHKQLDQYYRKHPHDRYFARQLLPLQQRYPLVLKEERCVLFASGKRTYAKLLLEAGLAIVPIRFKDERYEYDYRRSERKAKSEAVGLWSDPVLRNCMGQLEL